MSASAFWPRPAPLNPPPSARAAARANKAIESVAPESLARCRAYGWPGNVRELENLVERAVILCPGPVLFLDPLPEGPPPAANPQGVGFAKIGDLVRNHIAEALHRTGGRIYGPNGAAALLGLKPSTLQARLKKLDLVRNAGPKGLI